MGILDDAIREHLELKRRHGAAAAEVERLEREALGGGEAPAVEARAPAEPETPAEPEALEPAVAAPEAPPAQEHPPAEPESAEPEPAPRPEHVDQPTRQFTLEELEEAERREGEAEHDELEDTPEFLQETPEHDRLWFEQKPPKDFDF